MGAKKKRGPITISLFSGGGGMDLGFSAAGFQVCLCNDIDPYSCKTLSLNGRKKSFLHSPVVVEKSIAGLSGKEILDRAKLREGQVDFVIGGPPCQAFSIFGRRQGLKDPRGNLVWEYLRIIKELRPIGFVFENVAGLKSIHNGQLYTDLLESLTCNGEYVVSDHNYEIADFGIPQYRNRIFFVGYRRGRRIPPMIPTHGPPDAGLFNDLRPWVTVGQVLRGMPEPGMGSGLPNHIGRVHSDRIIARYKALEWGERDAKTRINKLNPEKPSFTIIVGSDAGGGKGHVHPFIPREVTPRESARLQTFPDWWEFYGKGRHVIRQVGNAVPPLFAALLAEHIGQVIFDKYKAGYDNLVELLGLSFLKYPS
jgi:DNA (cytosine-5)-methyltransferase 1